MNTNLHGGVIGIQYTLCGDAQDSETPAEAALDSVPQFAGAVLDAVLST
ncbi:MAG: hypothetical protein Q4C91_11775 [Eubacteriales bacterium]|nr:hypothetical protein [Eubacteriales bacterium]